MYLLTLALIAVLASPLRSYTAANRGETLFQFGMSGIVGWQNAATKRPAPRQPAWISALKGAKRESPERPGILRVHAEIRLHVFVVARRRVVHVHREWGAVRIILDDVPV